MRNVRSILSLGLLGALAACSGEELTESMATDSFSLAASSAGLKATFSVSSSWGDGFTGVVTIANTTSSSITDWELKFKLNGGATISGAPWGAGGSATQGSDGTWTILPNPWGGNVVPANGSVTVSFGGAGGAFSGV